MALPIKTIPVLFGEAADRFDREAEENAKRPTPRLSPERKARLDAFLEHSRQFQIHLFVK